VKEVLEEEEDPNNNHQNNQNINIANQNNQE
jgi:hypothetical protein